MKECEYEVAIIGAGVTGCAIARELSRYDISACVIERCEDVCSGTSKANSGIVHGGHDAECGTLKAKMNVEGNKIMEKLSHDLDFSFKRNGAFVCCFDKELEDGIQDLYDRGVKNGVPNLKIITGDQAREIEPNLSDEVYCALYIPTSGIVDPFGLTIALAENACDNGVDFILNTAVVDVKKQGERWLLSLDSTPFAAKAPKAKSCPESKKISARYVVNAAGVYADVFHNKVSTHPIKITPRKGDYCLFDKTAGSIVSKTIFQQPTKKGKGVLVTPTVHGNLLVGPTATDIQDKEGGATTAQELSLILEKSKKSVKNIPYREVITSFSGLRAHPDSNDFILGEVEDAQGFFDAAGIESPGLSSAPAIGVYIASLIAKKAGYFKKENFNATRRGIPHLGDLPFALRAKLIRERADYGSIVCRCEDVSEGEIVDAINRTLGATSLDGLKRRVRAGMGRCQAGFCTPKKIEILARECGIKTEEVCKNQAGSEIIKTRSDAC